MSRTALILKHVQLPLLPEGGEVVDVSLQDGWPQRHRAQADARGARAASLLSGKANLSHVELCHRAV
jgi:hypothetical protein